MSSTRTLKVAYRLKLLGINYVFYYTINKSLHKYIIFCLNLYFFICTFYVTEYDQLILAFISCASDSCVKSTFPFVNNILVGSCNGGYNQKAGFYFFVSICIYIYI